MEEGTQVSYHSSRSVVLKRPNTHSSQSKKCSHQKLYVNLSVICQSKNHVLFQNSSFYMKSTLVLRLYSESKGRTHPQKEIATIKEDHVVIVKEQNCPRNKWRLGHVKEFMKEQDGKTLGKVVTIAGKQNQLSELRPVQHLVPVQCRKNNFI